MEKLNKFYKLNFYTTYRVGQLQLNIKHWVQTSNLKCDYMYYFGLFLVNGLGLKNLKNLNNIGEWIWKIRTWSNIKIQEFTTVNFYDLIELNFNFKKIAKEYRTKGKRGSYRYISKYTTVETIKSYFKLLITNSHKYIKHQKKIYRFLFLLLSFYLFPVSSILAQALQLSKNIPTKLEK